MTRGINVGSSSIMFTYAAVERVEVMSIPSNVAWVRSFNVRHRRRNIEMPRGRPMEYNFFLHSFSLHLFVSQKSLNDEE